MPVRRVSNERRIMKKLITLTLGLILVAGMGYAAFDQHTSIARTPHIGTIKIELTRTVNPDILINGVLQAIEYRVSIDDQFDNAMSHKSGDLIPHLTAGQITQLQAFMDSMWVKAENEILP